MSCKQEFVERLRNPAQAELLKDLEVIIEHVIPLGCDVEHTFIDGGMTITISRPGNPQKNSIDLIKVVSAFYNEVSKPVYVMLRNPNRRITWAISTGGDHLATLLHDGQPNSICYTIIYK